MAYPSRLLGTDEELVCDLHPHWKVLVGPVLVLVVVLGLASFLAAAMPEGAHQGMGRLAVLIGALLLLGYGSGLPFLRWVTTHLVITDRRVLVRTGVLSRVGRDIPLSRINDITFRNNLVERVLGCGTLIVESAGERGSVLLPEVPGVERVQRELYDLVERADRRQRGLTGD